MYVHTYAVNTAGQVTCDVKYKARVVHATLPSMGSVPFRKVLITKRVATAIKI